jgi:hypothetical protein
MLRSREREEILQEIKRTEALFRLPEESPQPESDLNGREIIRNIESHFKRYVVLPDRAALPIVLWVLITYDFHSFDALPYLLINSPAPRCGKTRLLECLELTVHSPRRASNISEAGLFRLIEKERPTLLLDEAETLNGKGERAEYLRQILNAGNRRGAKVTRCVGKGAELDVRDFTIFCPKVFAGIGNFPQTITDRAIVISMQRRRNTESVERFLYKRAEPECVRLKDSATRFMELRREEIIAAYDQTELDFVSDRDAEAWAPLFAILAVADPGRLSELKEAALKLTGAKVSNAEEENLSLRLLADIREVWPETEPKIFTRTLIERLQAIEDSPWSSVERFDGRRLSRMLRPFGVSSKSVQIGTENLKGFCREDAEDAFRRYLGTYPSEASETT